MKLKYAMDISERSYSLNHTPGFSAQRLPFCATGCGYFQANGSYFTEREGLDHNYLLIYTLSGQGYLKYRGAEHTLEPNRIVVFDCSEHHVYGTAGEVPWEFKWVHFSGVSIEEYGQMINGDSLSVITLEEDSRTGRLLDEIYLCIRRNDLLLDVKICSCLVTILTDMITCRHNPQNARKYHQHKPEIDKAIRFMCENYSQKLLIDDIIGLLHVSKFHFLRLFKTYTGMTLYEYLNNYRIGIAKNLLKTTESTVGEIASRVGFGDVNSFIAYFKKVTGTTPANFRKYWIH